jgi:hypothetical protein
MEKEENQPETKPTETLVEQNDRDEVDTHHTYIYNLPIHLDRSLTTVLT